MSTADPPVTENSSQLVAGRAAGLQRAASPVAILSVSRSALVSKDITHRPVLRDRSRSDRLSADGERWLDSTDAVERWVSFRYLHAGW